MVFVRLLLLLTVDPNPPQKKVKRLWGDYDVTDPNWEINDIRVSQGRPPVDRWNIGVEYVLNGTFYILRSR